jgi:hypothetical protein
MPSSTSTLIAAKQHLQDAGQLTSEIKPYWILDEVDDPCRVERLIPLPPFSSKLARLMALKRSLAVYRLAYGQPRQDDLISDLTEHRDDSTGPDFHKLQLNLAP